MIVIFAYSLHQMKPFILVTAMLIITKLFVGNLEYCDICVCTFVNGEAGLHIEWTRKDQPFCIS